MLYSLPTSSFYFNPRTREGCDLVVKVRDIDYKKFQSTHPRRVRPTLYLHHRWQEIFQSTHPRRVRPSTTQKKPQNKIFQSTHPRRVRRVCPISDFVVIIFQSTHPRRVRHKEIKMVERTKKISIHAPAKGATPYDC